MSATTASVFPKIAGARPLVQAAPWEAGSQVAQTRVTPQTISPMALKKKNNPALRVPSAVLRAASELTDDPFWVRVLREASDGRWPRGFKFKAGSLSFQHKTKTFEEPVSDDMDPQDVCERIIKFIKQRGDRQSDRDRERVTRVLRGGGGRASRSAPPADKARSAPGDGGENAGTSANGGSAESSAARESVSPGSAPPAEPGVVQGKVAWKYKRGRPALLARYVEDRGREHGLSLRACAELFEAVQFCRHMGWLTLDTIEFAVGEKATPASIFPRVEKLACIQFGDGRRWEVVPLVPRSYASHHSNPDSASGSLEQVTRAAGAAEDPTLLDPPNESDMKQIVQGFRENMKVQNGERFLGSPLRAEKYVYSVRSAHAAAMAASPKILVNTARTPLAQTPGGRAKKTARTRAGGSADRR